MRLDDFIAALEALRIQHKINYDTEIAIATDDFGLIAIGSLKIETIRKETTNDMMHIYYNKSSEGAGTQKVIVLDID